MYGIAAAGIYAALRRIVDARCAWAIAALYVVHPLCANAVLWLASPHSKFITGHALPIDGGITV